MIEGSIKSKLGKPGNPPSDHLNGNAKMARLESDLRNLRDLFEIRITSQDAALKRIEEAMEKARTKPQTDWFKFAGLASVLMVVFGAYAYPMRRDIDDARKAIQNHQELFNKDLSLIRADFEAVKRENVWNWDGMKTRLDNLSKQIDRVWSKTFGESEKK